MSDTFIPLSLPFDASRAEFDLKMVEQKCLSSSASPLKLRLVSRQQVLETVATYILKTPLPFVLRVAIDGVDGAGKTHFADELGPLLAKSGRAVIRASVDGFHHSKEVRYRLGRGSPEGYYRDSYDYEAFKKVLLNPLSPGGSGRYRTAVHDVNTEMPVSLQEQQAESGAILLLDGIFLHRPELQGYWDVSVWLEVPFSISVPRMAQRDGNSPDPDAPEHRRYIGGQKLYFAQSTPQRHTTFIINNSDLNVPFIVSKD